MTFNTELGIKDVAITTEFMQQYCDADKRVRRAVDKMCRLMLDSGRFPNSFNAHPAFMLKGVAIGWITCSAGYWRVLFTFEEGVVEMFWLGTKSDTLTELGRLQQ